MFINKSTSHKILFHGFCVMVMCACWNLLDGDGCLIEEVFSNCFSKNGDLVPFLSFFCIVNFLALF